MEVKLKDLSRKELLEVLLEKIEDIENLQKENQRLQEEKNLIEQKLNEKISIEKNAGSIAEEALQITKIYEQAQASAEIYLDAVKRMADVEARNFLTDKKNINLVKVLIECIVKYKNGKTRNA